MTPLKKTARIAGLWYLMLALGPFYLLYVPSQTIVRNDAAATSALIISHEKLFRFGLLAETLGAVVFIGLALALYRLFEDENRHRARQMVGLVLVSGRAHPRRRRLQCGRAHRVSRRRCLGGVRPAHPRSDRHAPDPVAWTVEWG